MSPGVGAASSPASYHWYPASSPAEARVNVPRATSNCTVDNLDGGEGGEEVVEVSAAAKPFLSAPL